MESLIDDSHGGEGLNDVTVCNMCDYYTSSHYLYIAETFLFIYVFLGGGGGGGN